jgi:hypothetical protein
MNTNDLISALANNDPALGADVPPRMLWALMAGAVSSMLLCLVFWGVLAGLFSVMHTPAFMGKLGVGVLTAASGLLLWPRMLRPGSQANKGTLLACVPAVAAWVWALAGTDTPIVSQAFSGMWTTCSMSIAALAGPAWLWLMWHARRFAPTALRQAGALSGVIAGGIGAAVYSLYCPVFDAGYIAVWYVLGIALCVLFGAVVGPRALRW